VQVGHVCLEAGNQFDQPTSVPVHLVLLEVASERHLQSAVAWLELQGIQVVVFWEPDDNMGHTAACTAPLVGTSRQIFKRFPLWRNPLQLT
jgi:hypothetical protein